MSWLVAVGVGLCFVAACVAVSSAGAARTEASVAVRNSIRARSAADDAEMSARVARTVTGVDYSFDRAAAAELDPSSRLLQDCRAGAATAQRIGYRTRTPRTAAHSFPDVFVKSNP